jgi:hypothetical protein
VLAGTLVMIGCNGAKDGPSLSKATGTAIPDVPEPPADGPQLGSIANLTPVRSRPAKDAKEIGYLHAGAKVARAEKAYSKDGCPGGWYPIRPRGFVCVGSTATIDMNHPTLAAMALGPKLDQPLPYTYASTRKDTPLYERDPKKKEAVKKIGMLPEGSGLAIIGSWSGIDPKGRQDRLGMTTDGHFVRAADLRAAEPSSFHGVDLGATGAAKDLPIGFIVKRGVRAWKVDKGDSDKLGRLDYHDMLPLTGRFRTLGPVKYWAMSDGRYVRHRDVTVIRRRNIWPDFATGKQKWIDVSIITGTLVLYQGHKAVFATLVSVGRDRLGDPKTSDSTAQGDFDVLGKHITAVGLDPKSLGEHGQIFDAPWAIELSSGQMMLGAFWHDRFGIEHGPGAIEMSPADAQKVWQWVDPQVPEGWHGVTQPDAGKHVVVHIRK